MERAELGRLLLHTPGERPQETLKHDGGPILVDAAEPHQFMRDFTAAVLGTGDVFLCNPQWSGHERTQLQRVLPDFSSAGNQPPTADAGWLMIPTGGSSGQLKFARHDANTLESAVRGFSSHFDLPRVNSIGVLPLHHVSGLMAWMRSALTGGIFKPWNWKALEAGECPELESTHEGWVISLVPTQLERLLRHPALINWLRSFRIIFVGGAPARADLLEQAAKLRLPISLGYGMTETAAMVTAQQPADFLAGDRSCGRVLPHAKVTVNESGVVQVSSSSLFRGYYPQWRENGEFETADRGRMDHRGQLSIIGRRDEIIISGGEKIDPEEVASVLRASGQFSDLAVVGISDAEWGQVLVVAYPLHDLPSAEVIDEALKKIAAIKRPKQFVALPKWPVNEQDKLNRAEVVRLIQHQRQSAPNPQARFLS